MPTQLPFPTRSKPASSPDGQQIAYTPLADRSAQWKHYRGGTHSQIWIYHRDDHRVDKIPQPEGRANDLDPNWIGETIYFRSDRNGEYNLFAFDTQAKTVKQLTAYGDFPVLNVASGGRPADLRAGGLPAPVRPGRGEKHAAEDRRGHRPGRHRARDTSRAQPKYIRNADISPSGARAVFEYRGEIVTVPAEKGDPRNLTESPGVNDR